MTDTHPKSSASKLQFIIGIDGGGTKTLGRIKDKKSGKTLELQAGSASLTNDFHRAKRVIGELLKELLDHFNAKPSASVVVIGVAGGGVEVQAQKLMEWLPSDFAQLEIFNDAKTSLYGANHGKPIAVVALGTGSVGARLESTGEELYVGGWGFPIGDEGSGAKLGFKCVQMLLEELDWKNEPESLLAKKVHQLLVNSDERASYNKYKQLIAEWLGQANAKDFAALVPPIFDLISQCEVAKKVVHEHVKECETLIQKARADSELDVMLMGGLASDTLQYLTENVTSYCKLASGSSLDGACILAEESCNKLSTEEINLAEKQTVLSGNEKNEILNQLSNMVSETPNPDSVDLDLLSTKEVLRVINSADKQVPQAIDSCLDEIEKAVNLIVDSFEQGGRLIYVGAGTSGRLGVLDAVECPPTFSVEEGKVIGLIAGGDKAIHKAVEGAEDSEKLGKKDIEDTHLSNIDTVVGIAASGRTPYVIGALDYAKSIGANTITLSCNPKSILARYGDVNICPVVGPEVLTGSTRMKSGTAQKLVLNMLTTTSMIKIGKSFGNLMVDVKASNKKLYVRAIRIVMQATLCSAEEAEVALESCSYNVKVAILHILTNVDVHIATQALLEQKGFLRKAIEVLSNE